MSISTLIGATRSTACAKGFPARSAAPPRWSHIRDIFQIGLRAAGSARQEEVDAALAYGANLITAYDVHDNGMESVLDAFPMAAITT